MFKFYMLSVTPVVTLPISQACYALFDRAGGQPEVELTKPISTIPLFY